MGDAAREQIEQVIERLVEEYTAGDYVEDWDVDGLFTQVEQIWPSTSTQDEIDPSRSTARSSSKLLTEDALRALRGARGGAGRGAHARARALPAAGDHRPALARAPLRHGLPARGHPPARVRPDRSARRVQERGVHALPGPDELDLDRLRADDLQRRGGDRGRRTARAPCRRRAPRAAPPRRRPRLLLGRRSVGSSRARSPWRWPAPTGRRGLRRRRGGGRSSRRAGRRAAGRRRVREIGRNDPCWCGSGKKFKKCHGA